MSSYVHSLQNIDNAKVTLAGGKGANLGRLFKIAGIHVPDGFCISTQAFDQVVRRSPSFKQLLDQLCRLKIENRNEIGVLSFEIRQCVEGIEIPRDLQEELVKAFSLFGEASSYAVRSSATAEDLPTASFAGQQDTFLNICGCEALFEHIRKCWASLYTERAVTYRIHNGLDHRKVLMAVVMQRMVFPEAAGILFTVDPVTSNRKVTSIDATFGLGEALVSGAVNADVYKVRNGNILSTKIASKKLAIVASSQGGTREREIEPQQQNRQVLSDEQILHLERLGRRIEAHFGSPQDIEWCLTNDTFYVVQSRPITTLFPIPEANDDENHVYVSVGHQQMMTDPMKPLGLSFFQITAGRSMYRAAGRLFVDVAEELASPSKRDMIIKVLGRSDPLIGDALLAILERKDFIPTVLPGTEQRNPRKDSAGFSPTVFQTLKDYDPQIVIELIESSEASIEELRRDIQTKSGPALFDFILEDMERRRKSASDSQSLGVIVTAMNAASWLNEKMMDLLGEKNVADTLSQSVSNNITSEMGLALLDVADVIRPYPEVIEYLQNAKDHQFLDGLIHLDGGPKCREAIEAFLDRYGVRCVGEIDITRPRWCERPTALVPILLGNVRNFLPNASHLRFERGRLDALRKEQSLLDQLRLLPDGDEIIRETKRMISLVRNLSGYREYPKFAIVSRYFIYKQALLKEAARLVQNNILSEEEDIFYFRLEELRDLFSASELDSRLIRERKEEYDFFQRLTPPRVITSEGEIVVGRYKRDDVPADALVGIPVSSGLVEGRARVVLNLKDAILEKDDVLVTSFTDPSWTPLFVSVKGLVTEVGGLMTHGAVIAREYGLPAVVGVENATKLIEDGRRIRVHGTEGYVELL